MKKTAAQIAWTVLNKLAEEDNRSWIQRHPYATAGIAAGGALALAPLIYAGVKRFRPPPKKEPSILEQGIKNWKKREALKELETKKPSKQEAADRKFVQDMRESTEKSKKDLEEQARRMDRLTRGVRNVENKHMPRLRTETDPTVRNEIFRDILKELKGTE